MNTFRMTNRSSASGFTLMEVLIAMGIFVVGVIAVAAIFPTSIAVQRQTADIIRAQQVAQQAKHKLDAVTMSTTSLNNDAMTYRHDDDISTPGPQPAGTLADMFENGDDVFMRPLTIYDAGTFKDESGNGIYVPTFAATMDSATKVNRYKNAFPRALRTYPEYWPRPDFVWFPFIKVGEDLHDSTTAPTWEAYVIVMRRSPDAQIPQVRRINAEEDLSRASRISFVGFDNDTDNNGLPDLVQPGDFVLGDNGLVHQVIDADADGATVNSSVLQNGNIPLQAIYIGVNVDTDGAVIRGVESPTKLITGFPSPLPVRDP